MRRLFFIEVAKLYVFPIGPYLRAPFAMSLIPTNTKQSAALIALSGMACIPKVFLVRYGAKIINSVVAFVSINVVDVHVRADWPMKVRIDDPMDEQNLFVLTDLCISFWIDSPNTMTDFPACHNSVYATCDGIDNQCVFGIHRLSMV